MRKEIWRPTFRWRLGLVAIMLVLLFPLAGCWDRTEVNDLGFVMGFGIDQMEDRKIEVSAELYVPTPKEGSQEMGGGGGGGGKNPQTVVISASGLTSADAVQRLQEILSRKIFFGHNNVFVIGENLARKGISEQIDFILKTAQIRENSHVFISKGLAKQTLQYVSPVERSSADMMRKSSQMKFGMNVTASEIEQMLNGDAGAAALPWLELLKLPNQKKPRPVIKGTAVFKKDKMLGHIDQQATQSVLWLRNESGRFIVTFRPKEAKGFISFEVVRLRTKLIPYISNNNWIITAQVHADANIIQNETNLILSKPEVSKVIQQEFADYIRMRIAETLEQMQTGMRSDVFGFADAFHRKYPEQWRMWKNQWNDKFPTVRVQVKVQVTMRTGKTIMPKIIPQEEPFL